MGVHWITEEHILLIEGELYPPNKVCLVKYEDKLFLSLSSWFHGYKHLQLTDITVKGGKNWAKKYSTGEDFYITVSATEADGLESFKLTPCVFANGVYINGDEM